MLLELVVENFAVVERLRLRLQAGLNAVYIPHAHTWRLENEEISPGPGRLLVLERFAELVR